MVYLKIISTCKITLFFPSPQQLTDCRFKFSYLSYLICFFVLLLHLFNTLFETFISDLWVLWKILIFAG